MQDRLNWALAACARVFRPIVRLALGLGLKHPQLEGLLHDLLLEEATRLWRRQGVPSPDMRLGMCTRLDATHVELNPEGFAPAADLRSVLTFLGDNLRDHASSAVSNVLAEGPPPLERAVFAEGIGQADCDAAHQLLRQRWSQLHHELVAQLGAAIARDGGRGARRLRVGLYIFQADSAAGNDA